MYIFTPNTLIKSSEVNANFTESLDITKHNNIYKFSAFRSGNVDVGDFATYTIIYNTELFDSNNDYNTSTGEYTAPKTGYYQMNASALINGATGANAYLWDAYIELQIDNVGVDMDRFYVFDQGRFTFRSFRINNIYYLTAGQKVKIVSYGDTANGANWVLTGDRKSTSFSGIFLSN